MLVDYMDVWATITDYDDFMHLRSV